MLKIEIRLFPYIVGEEDRGRSRMISEGVDLIKLTYFLYVFRQTDLSKHRRSRSDTAEDILIATHSAFTLSQAVNWTLTRSKVESKGVNI